MTILAAQYLEAVPIGATPKDVNLRLRQAFERLPISLILLGWGLPTKLEEEVAKEASRHGANLFRWQPWLTGGTHTDLPDEWLAVGLDGSPIPGHDDSPDFTFICPNQNGVVDFLHERLENIAALGIYQGVFLDRIRFPSPAENPLTHLGCFCKHCTQLAADEGLDMASVRQYIHTTATDPEGAKKLVRMILGQSEDNNLLHAFLGFRCQSITRIVTNAKHQADSLGLSLGLDCFSPSLAYMVGQDLHTLNNCSDWIKLMIYPRVLGPAGLPYELGNIIMWLINRGTPEDEALRIVFETIGLKIPEILAEVQLPDLDQNTMENEILLGRKFGITNLFAGVAMVNMKGIHWATPDQIRRDLLAAQLADGLVISWDLWQTPLEHLDLIRSIMEKQDGIE
jgi:hypothetical protein